MIRIKWSLEGSRGQLSRDGGPIELSDNLETAVILSVFCWASREIQGLPKTLEERRGYWGDRYSNGDRWGSDLWRLLVSGGGGGRNNDETRELASGAIQRSLAWMVEDGIASSISVSVERFGRERVSFQTQILKAQGEQYVEQWEVTLAAA